MKDSLIVSLLVLLDQVVLFLIAMLKLMQQVVNHQKVLFKLQTKISSLLGGIV